MAEGGGRWAEGRWVEGGGWCMVYCRGWKAEESVVALTAADRATEACARQRGCPEWVDSVL